MRVVEVGVGMRLLVIVGAIALLIGVAAGILHARSGHPPSPHGRIVVRQVVTQTATTGSRAYSRRTLVASVGVEAV